MAKLSLRSNKKFLRLCRDLKRPGYQVRGLLEMMWESAYENSTTFRTLDDAEVVSTWDGEIGAFGSAVLSAGFLDEVPDGFMVHDYEDNAPYWWKERERKRKAQCISCNFPEDGGNNRGKRASSVAKRSEEKNKDSCGEAVPPSPPDPAAGEVFVKGNGPYTIDDDEVGMWFPVVGGKDARGWPLTKAHAKQLRASFKAKFPDAEVMRLEFEKARSWLINNPQRRKTPGGMPAFLNNWIGKTR